MRRIFRVKYLLCLMSLFTIISCSKEQHEVTRISDYSPWSMIYPSTYKMNHLEQSTGVRIKLIYDNKGRISERIGGFSLTSGIGGEYFKYSDKIKTIVEYDNNTATISTHSLIESYNTHSRLITLFFEGNKLVKRIEDSVYPYVDNKDITEYYYDTTGKISRTVETKEYKIIESTYHYDENDNLHQVILINSDSRGEALMPKETITFSDYDNVKNLTKNLRIFKECFYRSLSRNNFRKYTHEQYDTNGNIVYKHQYTFDILYDDDNNPIY